jgi:hypothetical protein
MMLAPTKEIAIGMKMRDLAMLPQRILSAKTAINNPNAVLKLGTTKIQSRLFRTDSKNRVAY